MNLKNTIAFIVLIVVISVISNLANNNWNTETESKDKSDSIESINNDLKMIQHIVKYAKEDAIETFNNSQPIPQGRFKAKDTTPLRIHDGLVDIDSLVVDIENKLNNLDYE